MTSFEHIALTHGHRGGLRAAADACDSRLTERGPYSQEDFADGLKAFYDAGTSACVALDAVMGPQVLPAGFTLVGRDPEQAHQLLLDYAAEQGSCSAYTPDDSLTLTDLRIQRRPGCR
ncbi:hypothetical protein ACIGMX_33070 [Streptomyces aquilus]|uniref:hypothetical protein n=1 Tax=Streptomyces aquilus TaxID=2548456 RepID=UPI0037D5DAAD